MRPGERRRRHPLALVAERDAAVVRDVERAVGAERRAVGAAAGDGDLALERPVLPERDALAADLGDGDALRAEPDRSFGELEAFGDDRRLHAFVYRLRSPSASAEARWVATTGVLGHRTPMDDHRDFFSAATALAAVATLDVDAMRLLFKVERSGEKFYEGIAERIGDTRAAELLRRNGREERGHAERVRRALGVKLGHVWEPSPDDLALYPIPLPDEIPAAAVAGDREGRTRRRYRIPALGRP